MRHRPKNTQRKKRQYVPQTPEGGLAAFVGVLRKINVNSPLAKLNEKSISDNNGRRIEF